MIDAGAHAPAAPPRPPALRDGPLLALGAWLLTLVATFSLVIALGVATGIIVAVLAAMRGERPEIEAMDIAGSTPFLWATVLGSQAVMLAALLVACALLRQRPTRRLGLSAPGVGAARATVLVVATIVPFAIGLLGAALVQMAGAPVMDSGLMRMWGEGTRLSSVLWVLAIAVVPGIVEELFYRGFVQRAFMRRWSPGASIAAASALFALAHVDPAHMVFTFVVGAWFGVVAWRTGSTLLPILMHAGMNGTWTAVQMVQTRRPLDETWGNTAVAALLVVGLVAFAWSIVVLRRSAPAPDREPGPLPASTPAWAGAVLVGAAALLLVIIPPGASSSPDEARSAGDGSDADRPIVPSVESMRERVAASLPLPVAGEVQFVLDPGAAIRLTPPEGTIEVEEFLVGLADDERLLWLSFDGEVSGQGTRDGPPALGVLVQPRSGDPTLLRLRLTRPDDGTSLIVRASLLRDAPEITRAWEEARSQPGWSTRGRR